MPAYEYTCQACSTKETRISGINDVRVECAHCGGEMIRLHDLAHLLACYRAPQNALPPAT